jgi:predicted amidohydrolase YtcJ
MSRWIIHPDDIARFAELKVVANFQPLWAAYDDYIKELNIPAIGEERTSWMYPIQSIKDAGGMVAFGSDWSVSTANPFYQMETAITRMDSNDYSIDPFIPEEAVSVETAIDAFTINAAFVNKHEDLTGSIEPGKYADLIVLDQNLMEIDARAISDTEVLLTLFAGEPVHGSLADL